MSSNPGKAVPCTEVPRDENILTIQSGINDVVHPNTQLDHHDMSGSSAPILAATEGSLPHPVDDESKQMHGNSLDVEVSNNQFLKDSLPVIEHAGSSGEGLPYAPENWPSPGDVWTWRVGKRYTLAGFWQDRSVHPPDSLHSSTGSKMSFNSRVSLEQYIRNTFPDADVDAFFASFIWKIPCTNAAKEIANAYASPIIIKSNGCSKAAAVVRLGDCKASNEMCSIKAKTSSSLTPATCYICCTEPNFCRYCCCILCSKIIDRIYEGYNCIKCEAPIDEKFICGHVAHIECALRAYMAGKVGGSVDLDAQYYCRCCDNKTDLLLHVDKIIKVCESIDNRDDKVEVLNLGLCILRGSEKERATKLQNHIAMLMEMLKHGASADEICKKKSEISEHVQDKGMYKGEVTRKYRTPEPYVQRGSESDPLQKRSSSSYKYSSSHKSYKRGPSKSPPCDSSRCSKHHKSHHKRSSPPVHQSGREQDRSLTGYSSSVHPGSHIAGSSTAAAIQTTMAPLHQPSSRTPLIRPESPDYPRSERYRLKDCGPPNTRALRDAIQYALATQDWVTSSAHNFTAVKEKYDFAKLQIGQDRAKIEGLQRDLKTAKEENQKLSNFITSQCAKVTESEQKVTEMESKMAEVLKAKETWELEKKSLHEERDRLLAEAATSANETQELRESLRKVEEERDEERHKVVNLDIENSRLMDENIKVELELVNKQEIIEDASDTIESVMYNMWKHKGLTWAEEYDEWMLMIKRRSAHEALLQARETGEKFDEELHLLTTFTDAEREAINRAKLAEEAEASSPSWSGSGQASDILISEDEGEGADSKKAEELDGLSSQTPGLPTLHQSTGDDVNLINEPAPRVDAGTMPALIVTSATEASTIPTLATSSVASVGGLPSTDLSATQKLQ